jgi:hypothetical protein
VATASGRNEALELGAGGWPDDAPEGRAAPDDALELGAAPDDALEPGTGRWLKDSLELGSGQ